MRVLVRVSNPFESARAVDVPDALVDTGATVTTVPREIATRLGLRTRGQVQVRTASGVEMVDRSIAWLEIQGKDGFSPVTISDTYPGVLIGVVTLETLGFAVDPKNERLVDAELLLL